jgi:hypothetical protein
LRKGGAKKYAASADSNLLPPFIKKVGPKPMLLPLIAIYFPPGSCFCSYWLVFFTTFLKKVVF